VLDVFTLGAGHLDDPEAVGDVLAVLLGHARLDRLVDPAGQPAVALAVPRLALAVVAAQRRRGGERVVRGVIELRDDPCELAIDPVHDRIDVSVAVERLVQDDEVDRLELVYDAAFLLVNQL
jgi:hypothetical protein